MLDTKTIVFSYLITNALITLFIALLWYQNRRRYAGLTFWLMDYILQAVGFLLLFLRDIAPDWASIIIAQMLIAGGMLCIYIGLERFVGKPSSQIHNYIIVGTFVGLMTYFTYVQPNIDIRTILISAASVLLTGQSSWLLLHRVEPALRAITRDAGVVFLLYALVALVRIFTLLIAPMPATGDLFQMAAVQVAFLLINQILCIALTFTLTLMVTRRSETALHASEARYRSLFENMLNGYAYCKMLFEQGKPQDFVYLDVNPAFEMLTGLKNVVGQKVSQVIPDLQKSNPELFETYGRVALTGKPERFETYLPALEIWLSISVFSPAQEYFVAVFDNITERKRAQQEIEHLASFPRLNPNPVLEVDATGTITFQNDAATALLERVKQDAHALLPPDLSEILQSFARQEHQAVYREVETDGVILGENIHHLPQFNVARIYTIDITERKQVGDALRENEEKLRVLFEQLPIGVSLLDRNRKMIYANAALAKIMNLARDDLMQGKFAAHQYVRPDGTPMLPDEFASVRAFREQRPIHDVETGIITESGETIWTSVSAAPFPMADKGVVVATIDIAERKRAEETLAVSETRYRRLFEAARDGILILDGATGMIVDVNPFLIEMLGFPREQFLQKRIWELRFFKDIAANRANFEELQRKEYIRYENLPLETGDGRQIEVEFVSNVYLANRHKVIQCNIRDITERKRAEAKQQELLYSLNRSVNELNCLYSIAGAIERGGSLEEMLGSIVRLVPMGWQYPEIACARIVLEDREFKTESFAETDWKQSNTIVAHGKSVGMIEVCYLEKASADGEEDFTKEESNLLYAIAERLGGVIERKRAEAALQEYSERLEQMVEARTRELRDAHEQLVRQERLTMLGQIAGGIGHELRSPLGAIKNAIYLLNLSLPKPDPDIQETMDILKRQVDASDRIITSLLDIARPKPPYRRATNLRETLDAALDSTSIPENIQIIKQLDDTLPALSVDPDQLQIVFGNLIRNAIQAMPDGGRLTLATQCCNREIAIAFSDTGAGMTPEVLDKLFQPMFTTKTRGLGLGLALCKLLVEGHNGRIQVTSQVGEGTTFIVYLPLTQEARDG